MNPEIVTASEARQSMKSGVMDCRATLAMTRKGIPKFGDVGPGVINYGKVNKGVFIMFKHILVPVDGSATAQMAVQKAIGLAQVFGSRVTAIFVIDPYPFTGVGTDFAYGQAEYLNAATAEANLAIKATKTAFEQAGVKVDTSVVESHAAWRYTVMSGLIPAIPLIFFRPFLPESAVRSMP